MKPIYAKRTSGPGEVREDKLEVRMTRREKELIKARMAEAGITNMSAYMRKMAIDGFVVRLDLSDVKELVRLLRYCSNNLNQYAKKANATDSIYERDILDLKNRLDKIWLTANEILVRLSGII